MKSDRTYRAGRDCGKYIKGEKVMNMIDIHTGDLLIRDSHRFRATNLVKVVEIKTFPHIGFAYAYARQDGKTMGNSMFAHRDSLQSEVESFYKAVIE